MKLMKRLKKITLYKEVFEDTKPLYWFHFIEHAYIPKRNRISKYVSVPNNLKCTYLKFDFEEIQAAIDANNEKNIITCANLICEEGQVKVFDVEVPDVFDNWDADPVTKYRWPNVFFAEVRKITPQGSVEKGNDIKYPWELSNSHFLVTLAQAFVLTSDKRYQEYFFKILDNWEEKNPVGYGVNWSCTMDVALRAINIIVSASIFNASDSNFDSRFKDVIPLLYSHMLFIRDNLEYGFVRENHYLSDIVGLKMLAQFFAGDKSAEKIYKFSSKSFLEEIDYQLCNDGADHEASSCYHCFVVELFFIGLATDEKIRSRLSDKYIQKLAMSIGFLQDLCSFASYPIIGDNDSGRVLDLNGNGEFRKQIRDFGEYVLTGNIALRNEYAFLLIGKSLNLCLSDIDLVQVHEYQDGGYIYAACNHFKILQHAGSIGRKGKGGHGHNDQTSFVLDIDGESIIVDPGSFVYERNLKERHWFRSSESHNSVCLGKNEQNSITWNNPFKMECETKAAFSCSVLDDGEVKIYSKHYGYSSKLDCFCERTIRICDKVVILDTLTGSYIGPVSILFTFAEGIEVNEQDTAYYIKTPNGNEIRIVLLDNVHSEMRKGRVSRSYGTVRDTLCLYLEWDKSSEKNENIIVIDKVKK